MGREHRLAAVRRFEARELGLQRGRFDPLALVDRLAIDDPDELDADLASRPERYTPWLRLEWPQVRESYREVLGFEA